MILTTDHSHWSNKEIHLTVCKLSPPKKETTRTFLHVLFVTFSGAENVTSIWGMKRLVGRIWLRSFFFCWDNPSRCSIVEINESCNTIRAFSARERVSPSGSTFTCTTKISRSPSKVLRSSGRGNANPARWAPWHSIILIGSSWSLYWPSKNPHMIW